MMKIYTLFLLFFAIYATSLHSFSPQKMMDVKNISDVQISPDHQKVLFVVTSNLLKDNVQRSIIYSKNIYSSKEALPFSASDYSSIQPRWSPDGQWIAFISERKGVKNLYLISAHGGEAKMITNGSKDVQNFSWSPDSSRIAFVMEDQREGKKDENTQGVYEYGKEELVNRLFLIDIHSYKLEALTSDDYCIRCGGDLGIQNLEFDWSPDANHIVFAFSRSLNLDDLLLESSLATIDLSSRKITSFPKKARKEFIPRYSPDGEKIAYLHEDSAEKYSFHARVAISTKNGQERQLLASTFNEGQYPNGTNLLGWTADGSEVLFFEPKQTKFHLLRLPVSGAHPEEIKTGELYFHEPVLSVDKHFIGFVSQDTSYPPEAYISSIDNFSPVRISKVNGSFETEPNIVTEVIRWPSSDGLEIEGLLTYPSSYEPENLYPLLLIIHGGPAGFFDQSFVGSPNPYPVAAFAEAGFFVLRANPRGSSGYGKQFRCANYGDWGGMDFMDLMTGVDHLIAQKKADPERLGVMGWSYGGYMTAWTIGQTSRFKAASMGAGLSNLVSMNGSTDLDQFLTDYLGNFHEKSGLYERLSPLYYVDHVTTPCLIQHGADDKRVPISQSYEFYKALHRLGKESKLIIYSGTEHKITAPQLILDAMERNLEWFKTHL